jgi:hypothetical protein
MQTSNLILIMYFNSHPTKPIWQQALQAPILSNYGLFHDILGLNSFVKKVLRFMGKSTEIYFSYALKLCLQILITLAPGANVINKYRRFYMIYKLLLVLKDCIYLWIIWYFINFTYEIIEFSKLGEKVCSW